MNDNPGYAKLDNVDKLIANIEKDERIAENDLKLLEL